MGDAIESDGSATLTWRRWRRWWDEEDEGGRLLSSTPLLFFVSAAAAIAAAAPAEGVTESGPKKPAAAGVPGESGAVAVASTGQASASDVDTVRETRRSPSPTAAGLVVVTVGVSLGVQQFWMHVSQTRFGAV